MRQPAMLGDDVSLESLPPLTHSHSPSVSFSAQITKPLEEGFDTDIPFRAKFGACSLSKKERET